MATVTATDIKSSGGQDMTEVTLTGTADTFVYQSNRDPILIMRNPTGGAIDPTIDGDGGSTKEVAGLGSVDISGGYNVGSIAAGEAKVINLKTIEAYLQGTIAITSGTDLVCSLLEN